MKYSISDALANDLSPANFGYGLSADDVSAMNGDQLAAHGAKVFAERMCSLDPSLERRADGVNLIWGGFTFKLPPHSQIDQLQDSPDSWMEIQRPEYRSGGV